MNHEHDDDVEPEVTEGAAIETEVYPPLAEDVEDTGITDRESARDEAAAHVEPDVDDEPTDTI